MKNNVRVRLLKVMRCQDAMMWYAPLVGEYVPCLGLDHGEWRSRAPSGYSNFIAQNNARVVHVFVSPDKLGEYPYKYAQVERPAKKPQPVTGQVPMPTPWPAPAMGQSHRASAIEAATNIVLGFGISVGITAVLFPSITLVENIGITSVFTVASFARAYGLRRLFNWLLMRQNKQAGT